MRKFLSVTKGGKEQIFISLGLTFVTKNKAEYLNQLKDRKIMLKKRGTFKTDILKICYLQYFIISSQS